MPASPPISKHRISLGALLAGWGLIVLWISWIRVANGVIDDIRQREQAAELAKSAIVPR